MINTVKDIKSICFPVFLVGEGGSLRRENDVIIYTSWYGKEGIVDDLSFLGTFAERRSQIPDADKKALGIAIYFHHDLVKFKNTKHLIFVDSTGRFLIYNKSKFVDLTFHKIDHWIRLKKEVYVLVKLEGFPQYFKSLKPPQQGDWYAGLLHLSKKQVMLYGFYPEKYDRTIRKI